MFDFNTAKTTKNNSEIIARFQISDIKIVLCHWNNNQYVTWRADNQGYTYWGHYFNNIQDATNDFTERCKNAKSFMNHPSIETVV